MATLLVRNVEEALVRKLKRRAAAHSVSAEEEHRRILKESLTHPSSIQPSLIDYLVESEVAPNVELELSRRRADETRDIGF